LVAVSGESRSLSKPLVWNCASMPECFDHWPTKLRMAPASRLMRSSSLTSSAGLTAELKYDA
jgi:hypothetical protein